MREDERAAHISSALGLRKTAHQYFKLSREWPQEAYHYASEAKRLLKYARWNLSMVRHIDTWRETND